MNFADHGAERRPSAVGLATVETIKAALAGLPSERAGFRLHGVAALAPILAAEGALGAVAADVLGPACRPVRALLFDKTAATNWSLGWHQDRTIVVSERLEVEGFGPWTIKGGLLHVAPPFEVLARMATLRLHLDPTPESNAPLLVAPGSHRFGRITEADVKAVVQRCGSVACIAEPGDVWIYATPVLHASGASVQPDRRRVLQVDYAAEELPGGLIWRGV